MKKLFILSFMFFGLTVAVQAQAKATLSESAAKTESSASTTLSKDASQNQEAAVKDSEMSQEDIEKRNAERKAKLDAAQSKSDNKSSVKANATLKD